MLRPTAVVRSSACAWPHSSTIAAAVSRSGKISIRCGAVAVYGLVYDILRANAWLAANGSTAITVHYAYSPSKGSPNRCVPTSLDTAPTADPSWSDGCDFAIASAAKAPVTLVANTGG